MVISLEFPDSCNSYNVSMEFPDSCNSYNVCNHPITMYARAYRHCFHNAALVVPWLQHLLHCVFWSASFKRKTKILKD